MTDLRKWSENAFVMLAGLKESVQWELAPAIMKEIRKLVDEYPTSAAPSEGMKRLSPARSGEPPTVEGFVKSFLSRVAGLSEEQSSNIKETLSCMLRSYFSAAAPSSGEPSHQICQACCTEVCIHSRCPNCHRCDRCQERAARPSEPSAPQASAEPLLDKLRAIVFDQGRDVEYGTPEYFLLQRLRTAFIAAAPRPVSGDAPKVEEVPLARKAAYALAYAVLPVGVAQPGDDKPEGK